MKNIIYFSCGKLGFALLTTLKYTFHLAVLTIVLMYAISLGLIYLINESVYILTTFLQFFSLTPASDNHKSDPFSMKFLFVWFLFIHSFLIFFFYDSMYK